MKTRKRTTTNYLHPLVSMIVENELHGQDRLPIRLPAIRMEALKVGDIVRFKEGHLHRPSEEWLIFEISGQMARLTLLESSTNLDLFLWNIRIDSLEKIK